MYDIDVCYKLIFGAMLEEDALAHIAAKVHEYTKADVFFVSETGKILAYSCQRVERVISSLKRGYITLLDYEEFCNAAGVEQRIIAPVYQDGTVTGYIVILYADAAKEAFFQELKEVLSQVCGKFFEEHRPSIHLSLKERVSGRAVFDCAQDAEALEDMIEGQYLLLVFSKEHNNVGQILPEIKCLWQSFCIYEEESYITAVLYHMDQQSADRLRLAVGNIKASGCVSMPLDHICICRTQHDFLKCIADMEEDGIKREEDWHMKGFFTYAASLFREAELNDYAIQRLKEEDENNHTELYHTLKVYLMYENNITAAAEKLYIHRNTLVYRLKQIRDCIGKDINDIRTSRELLAFMMMYDGIEKQGDRL